MHILTSASRALLACRVHMPGRPAFRASSRSRHSDHSALIRALRALPAGQRRVVVLRHYWGLSVAETANDLGISEGSVKSQCAIGLHKLEEALTPDYRSEERE